MILHQVNDYTIVLGSLMPGLAVALVLSWRGRRFLTNLTFYVGSQWGVLALCLPWRPAVEVLGGTAVALAIYLAAFSSWLFTRRRPESMAWLGYVFSLPGAVIGAALSILFAGRFQNASSVLIGVGAAFLTLICIAINQIIVCRKLLYCGK